MSLPDFLVIGAMKSGTTTLYHDLRRNPHIFLPDKESNGLSRDGSLADYQADFRRATPNQIKGDVSTVYAMLPDSADVVPRATRFFHNGIKVVYVVRNPILRTLSHHNHMRTSPGVPRMGPDINIEILRCPELISYSLYTMQLRPWIDAFGISNVYVIVFEEYVKQRKTTIKQLSHFLGVEPHVEAIDDSVVHNQSDNKPLAVGGWRLFSQSAFYRLLIRPLTSLSVRDSIRKSLLPKANNEELVPPTPATLDFIVDHVKNDAAELQRLIGAESPLWDLEATSRNLLAVNDNSSRIGCKEAA